MLLSAERRFRSCDCSAEEAAGGAEVSHEMELGLSCTLGRLVSSEGLRRLGDWSPGEAAVRPDWSDTAGLSEPATSTGVSATALTEDFAVRARVAGRPGATLGLTENRFLLWTAAEELLASAFWSMLSLKRSKNSYLMDT